MPGRRRRKLSSEEAALWRSVAATATPLPSRDPELMAPAAPQPAFSPPYPGRSASPTPAAPPKLPKPEPPAVRVDLAPDPHAALAAAGPQMDRRRFDKLRRGRIEPDARLDLHGMTAARAHAALTAFILGAHGSGHRLVLVITGKGRAPGEDSLAPHRHGVLRHNLPHWLRAPPLAARILQVAPAHLRHGGTGAYYVYLRRQR